jgi:hypothetical protein
LDDRTPWIAARRITVWAGSGAAGVPCGIVGAAVAATTGAMAAIGDAAPVPAVAVAVGAAAVVDALAAAAWALLRSERRRQEPSPTVAGYGLNESVIGRIVLF